METSAGGGAHDVASSTDVVGSIRRHWIVAASIIVACALAAAVMAVAQPNRYTATSTVLVDSPDDVLPTAVNMATEKEIAGSPAVVELAVDALGLETPVAEVLPQIGVDVPVDSSILQISATAGDPDAARRLAGAMGHAYLDFQRQSSLDRVAASTELLDERIDTLTSRLRDLGSADVVDPADVAANRAEAAAILSQISILEQRIAAAATTDVVPGRIIADAVRPSEGSGPPIVASLAFGTVVGLLVAVGAVIAIGSFDRRVRTPKEVQVAMRARILGEVAVPRMLETSSNGDGVIADGHARAALTFRRLRTNLLVAIDPKSGPGRSTKGAARKPRTIAIVAARDEFATSYVAANLGAVLATDGRRVTVVSVSPTSPARLGAMLHVDSAGAPAEDPTSTEIRPTSVPNLHIAMAATDPERSGFLDMEEATRIIDAAANDASVVFVAAPPLETGEDGATLVAASDAAIFVTWDEVDTDELERRREEMELLATPLLGIVVLHRDPARMVERLVGHREDPPSSEPEVAASVASTQVDG